MKILWLGLALLNTAWALPAGVTAVQFDQAVVTLQGKTKKVLHVEAALTADQSERGLMYRKNMAKDSGMLFITSFVEQQGAFWMKNTYIPLDIAYFDSKGVIVDILQMKPCVGKGDNCPSYRPKAGYVGALEMNWGWFKKNGFVSGDKISYEIK